MSWKKTISGRAICTEQVISLVGLAFILGLTFLVYYQLRHHRFLSLDDVVYVTANPHVISGLSRDGWHWAVTTRKAEFWHPLTWISYMIDTELFGVQPGGYLLTNVLLHLVNTVLVFYLFRLLFQRTWESMVVAALFALHPLHVEAVAWISERKELLSAFFWLLSLISYWFYVQSPGWKRYLTVAVCFVLGYMAKSMIITLPFLLLVLDFWPFQRDLQTVSQAQSRLRVWRGLLVEKVPLLLLTLIGIGITLWARKAGGGVVSLAETSFVVRLANALVAYALYIKNTLWPTDLSVFYPIDKQVDSGAVFVSVLLLLGLSSLIWVAGRRRRFFWVGWLWFLGTLVPVIGLVQFGDFFMADRFMYMPVLGLFLILAGGLRLLFQHLSLSRWWLIGVFFLLLGIYAPRTWFQVQIWRNSQTLYTHALQVTKDNYLAHHALGETFAKKGYLQLAVFHFSRAAWLRPDKAAFWIKLGRAQAGNGDWRQAVNCFSRAASLLPDHPQPGFYLGCAMLFFKDIPAAVSHLSFSLEKIWEQENLAEENVSQADYYYKKGNFYDRDNQKSMAIQFYHKALKIMPGYWPAVQALTRLYQADGKTKELPALYGLSLSPDILESYVIVGYKRWKSTRLAGKQGR